MKQKLLCLIFISSFYYTNAQTIFPDTSWELQGTHTSSGAAMASGLGVTAPGPIPAGLDTAVLPTTTGRLPSPVLVDLDNDGDLDMVSGSQSNLGKLYYFENVGTSTSPNWVQTALATLDAVGFAPGGNNETKCQFIDIDDDGDMDLFYGSRYNATFSQLDDIHYYENTGTATTPNFVASTIPGIANQNVAIFPSFGFVDLDNDDDFDMVTMGSDSLAYFQNIGTKTVPNFERKYHLENPWDMNPGTGVTNRNWFHPDVLTTIPEFYDVDKDGDFDMIFGNDGGDVSWIENSGTASIPNFGAYARLPLEGDLSYDDGAANFDMGQFSTVTFGDVTGDGVLDAIAANFNPGYFAWFRGVDSTLGVDENVFAEVEMSPNPASDIVKISSQIEHIYIYDITGKKVMETNQNTFNVSVLNNGIYLIKITTNKGIEVVKRLVKE